MTPPPLFPARVIASTHIASEQSELVLEAPVGFAEAYTQPGQYCWVEPEAGSHSIYALLSTPSEGTPRFLVKTSSEVGTRIASLQAGDVVGVSLPTGPGFHFEPGSGPILLVAAGTGIAPMRGAVEAILRTRSSRAGVRLYYGVRSKDHMALGDELEAWRQQGLHVVVHTSRKDETGEGLFVQELVRRDEADLRDATIITAGYRAMVDELRASVVAAGGSADQIITNF